MKLFPSVFLSIGISIFSLVITHLLNASEFQSGYWFGASMQLSFWILRTIPHKSTKQNKQ